MNWKGAVALALIAVYAWHNMGLVRSFALAVTEPVRAYMHHDQKGARGFIPTFTKPKDLEGKGGQHLNLHVSGGDPGDHLQGSDQPVSSSGADPGDRLSGGPDPGGQAEAVAPDDPGNHIAVAPDHGSSAGGHHPEKPASKPAPAHHGSRPSTGAHAVGVQAARGL